MFSKSNAKFIWRKDVVDFTINKSRSNELIVNRINKQYSCFGAI